MHLYQFHLFLNSKFLQFQRQEPLNFHKGDRDLPMGREIEERSTRSLSSRQRQRALLVRHQPPPNQGRR